MSQAFHPNREPKQITPEFDTLLQPGMKLAYLVIRKSGCTSMKSALNQLRQPPLELESIHLEHPFLCKANELENPADWFKFTLVRDPITRFLSFYSNKILDQYVVGNATLSDRNRFGFTPNMKLDDAIDVLLDSRFPTEPHVVPQSDLFSLLGFELDCVGHLEKVSDFLDELFLRTGIRIPMMHDNKRSNKMLAVDERQWKRLAGFYSEDLMRFGYADNFQSWYKQNVEAFPDRFESEHGFEFIDEAKLLDYSIVRQRHRYLVELTFRVEPTQSRHLWIEFLTYDEDAPNRRRIHVEMESPKDLWSLRDENHLVTRRFGVPYEKLPQSINLENVFVEIFFWSDELEGAAIRHYSGKRIPLALPLSEDVGTQ